MLIALKNAKKSNEEPGNDSTSREITDKNATDDNVDKRTLVLKKSATIDIESTSVQLEVNGKSSSNTENKS